MYSRWRKIRGLDKDNPVKIQVKCNHHSKILRKKSNEDDTYFHIKIESLHYKQAILRNPPTHPPKRIK